MFEDEPGDTGEDYNNPFPEANMFDVVNEVPDYRSLNDLRHYMCNSVQWHTNARYWIALEVDDTEQRKQHMASLYWMMGVHARVWERNGFQFEPDDMEVLSWT